MIEWWILQVQQKATILLIWRLTSIHLLTVRPISSFVLEQLLNRVSVCVLFGFSQVKYNELRAAAFCENNQNSWLKNTKTHDALRNCKVGHLTQSSYENSIKCSLFI